MDFSFMELYFPTFLRGAKLFQKRLDIEKELCYYI